jgi:hypothetical protein
LTARFQTYYIRLSAFGSWRRLSAVGLGFRLLGIPAIGYRLSAIGFRYRLSAFGFRPPPTEGRVAEKPIAETDSREPTPKAEGR